MSPNARRSIRKTASVRGTGLHTGAAAEATFLPAPAGQGVVFGRAALPGRPEVRAGLTEVQAVGRRTAIGRGETTIHTIEHLLAAVAAHEIDDLTIELSGPELPILDGSVQPYYEALARADPGDVGGEPVVLAVQAPFTVTEGDASYVVAPAPALRLTVTIEWPHPLIGRQVGTYEVTPDAFARELAPARTFGFAHEVAALKAKGLIKGASGANAIVLDEHGLANGGQLRWPDEFVRHKAADIVGDLALTGARIRAHVIATRPSHGGNVALARALSRPAQRLGAPTMDIGRIMDWLPHRYPFLLVGAPKRCAVRDRARARATLPPWLGRVAMTWARMRAPVRARSPTMSAALWRTNSSGQRNWPPFARPCSSSTIAFAPDAPLISPFALSAATSCANPKVRAGASSRANASGVTSYVPTCRPMSGWGHSIVTVRRSAGAGATT